MSFITSPMFIMGASLLAIIYGLILTIWVWRQPEGGQKQREIADAIREGSRAFLHREYKTLAVVTVLVFALLAW